MRTCNPPLIFIAACHRASPRLGRGTGAAPQLQHLTTESPHPTTPASTAPSARTRRSPRKLGLHPAGVRDVPGRERWRVRARRCSPDGGAAPDAPAMPRRAAHAQPADGADGSRADGADAGRRRLLLLGQGSARSVRRFRRGLPDNFIHRRRHGDLSGTLRRLSFVHPATWTGGPGRDRHRAGLARGRTQFSRRQAGRDGVDRYSPRSSSRRSRYW